MYIHIYNIFRFSLFEIFYFIIFQFPFSGFHFSDAQSSDPGNSLTRFFYLERSITWPPKSRRMDSGGLSLSPVNIRGTTST